MSKPIKAPVAKEKVWRDKDGTLVPDGHESAVALVARKGQQLPKDRVAKFPNAEEYFDGLGGEEALPANEEQASEGEEEQEHGKASKAKPKASKAKRGGGGLFP